MSGKDDSYAAGAPVSAPHPTQGVVSRGKGLDGREKQAGKDELAKRAVRYGNPIAEILWPTKPSTPAGPFHRGRSNKAAAQQNRGKRLPRVLRKSRNLHAANGTGAPGDWSLSLGWSGLPVSARP